MEVDPGGLCLVSRVQGCRPNPGGIDGILLSEGVAMAISRRALLLDGAIFLGVGRFARGDVVASEDFAPVELEFPDLELDGNQPLVVGANTSGYNMCHVQVLDGE